MEIKIMSRREVEKIATLPFAEKTALISITDAEWTFAELKNKPEFLIQIAFDDVDNDVFEDELSREPTEEERIAIEKKYNMFTEKQAKEVAAFYKANKSDMDVLICQCEHGQSRSAAVVAAILEYESKLGIEIFADDKYYPNKVVFRKVLSMLKED